MSDTEHRVCEYRSANQGKGQSEDDSQEESEYEYRGANQDKDQIEYDSQGESESESDDCRGRCINCLEEKIHILTVELANVRTKYAETQLALMEMKSSPLTKSQRRNAKRRFRKKIRAADVTPTAPPPAYEI